MENTYIGHVSLNREYTVRKNGRRFSPRRSQRVFNHSPDGFCWGYCGSGPAQLALAILLSEGFSRPEAVRLHQDFKRGVVAAMPAEPGDSWRLTSETIMEWLAENTDADVIDLRGVTPA